MTDFTPAQQTVYFLSSIALGAGFAMVYDLVRAVRMLLRAGRAHLLVSDILFFFACGVATSLFALPFSKGDVRGFIIFGEAVGFLTYRLTLGSIFGKFYAVLARLLRQFIRKICEKLKNFFNLLLKAGAVVLYNIAVRVERIRRTAFSGVRTLAAESALARRRGRKKQAARDVAETERRPAVRKGKIYEIPQVRDPIGIYREEYEQKGTQTRKTREKTRRRRGIRR